MVNIYRGPAKTHCFHEPTYVFDLDGVRFYAASFHDLTLASTPPELHNILILNCSATNDSAIPKLAMKDVVLKMPARMAISMNETYINVKNVDEIHLNWPDKGLPGVVSSFWEDVLEKIQEMKYDGVICTCTGGHGRTGTALVALSVAAGYSAVDSIAYLRGSYCDKVLETKKQVDYIINLSHDLNGWNENANEQ